ncbi:hypothetical protein 3 [Sanxia tombus-like virus 4]|uniref:hypothetical protein 3 n=1 Tax=Sanxia tombus-like virus 4 TaxID=1923388 RepID=UPI00090A50FA|nr:hypothetical protein 3 [Sanxia tombus-like virus 4]APG76433.1 hypothetical protein 3 [Sanxia tombus-like virus 4]
MVKLSNRLVGKLIDRASGQRPRNGRRRVKRRRAAPRGKAATMRREIHVPHANVLANPSTAPLHGCVGIYEGEQGNITRLSLDYTIGGGAGNTCAYYIFHPNTGLVSGAQTTAGSTAIVPAFGVGAGTSPGYNLLNTNARKVRGIAAGMRFSIPSLSLTTIVGEVCVGVCSADTFMNVPNFTVDQLFLHSAGRGPINKITQDCAWYPGSFDARYSTYAGTIADTGSDLSDTNVFYFAIRGIPVSTNVQVKLDWVCEWVAKAGTGLVPSYTSNPGSNHQTTVAHLHENHPGWFHSVKSEAEAVGKNIVREGVKAARHKAEKWVPTMLESGFAAFGL